MTVLRAALFFCLCMIACAGEARAQARNAAFINPNTVSNKSSDGKSLLANTVVADPASVDAGETLVNVARRITVFFYNGYRSPVKINELTLNADGNVRSKILNDDCKTLKEIPVADRCAINVEVTPSSPGPWSIELLLNHTGQGRIARAEVNGSTLGKADERSEGLAISKKIAAPLDFGTVRAHEEKAARTMLIENDSTEPLLVSTIDLIASDGEGLTLRDVGCKEGESLKPGESCPVTVMWEPQSRGSVATDLIIRHNGNLGFVVVPIRGVASSSDDASTPDEALASLPTKSSGKTGALVPKTSGRTSGALPGGGTAPRMDGSSASVDAIADSLPPISANTVEPPRQTVAAPSSAEPEFVEKPVASSPNTLALIGTVGGRAILGDDGGGSHLIGLGERISINGAPVELLQLEPTHAVVNVAGRRMELGLRNAPTIMNVYGKEAGTSETGGEDTGGFKVKPRTPTQKPAESTSSSSGIPFSDGMKTGSVPTGEKPSETLPKILSPDGGLTAKDVLNMLN
jgi:hypothetical protein